MVHSLVARTGGRVVFPTAHSICSKCCYHDLFKYRENGGDNDVTLNQNLLVCIPSLPSPLPRSGESGEPPLGGGARHQAGGQALRQERSGAAPAGHSEAHRQQVRLLRRMYV